MSEKYPRTPHLPWSPGITSEDRVIESLAMLLNTQLVLTEKMDGSNVCLQRDGVFARSHNQSPRHASFHALKALHAALCPALPADWQVFGEWLWARHSIPYDRLPAYLLIFGIRDPAHGVWLAWDEQETWVKAHGLSSVPLLWQGVCCTEVQLQQRVQAYINTPAFSQKQEGVVVRINGRIANEDFARNVAKWVRPHHVQTDARWRDQKITRNALGVPEPTTL
jgi:hypothetical protein